jgi:peptidoglycan/xylan/chitin deacetylase (PgdA/CDA1 family)
MSISKPILMIHEFKESYLNLPLQDYILTFDDGLYSQYKYIDELQKFPTKKIFFISTAILCPSSKIQSESFITCSEAHEKAFKGNFEDYMTHSQVRHLSSLDGVEIGAHSNSHTRLNGFNSLSEKVAYINSDTSTMMSEFKLHLNLKPNSFCFPYNENLDGMYNGLLKKHSFVNFYGSERINIDEILEKTLPQI